MDVGVVVEEAVEAVEAVDDEEEVEDVEEAVDDVEAEVVAGAVTGAGVTFGVGSGVVNETYGSSVTLGCTMWRLLVAVATIRDGVSSPATANSARRCALCSSASSCCSVESRTCPLVRKACATTTARSDATTMEIEMTLRSRRFRGGRPVLR